MLRNLLIFLIIISQINICLADDPIALNKDDKAPFTGLLFSLDKAKDLKNSVIERDNYKLLNKSLQDSLDLDKLTENDLNKEIALLKTDNENLSDTLYKTRDANIWSHFLWFGLGVVATGLTVYVATKAR